MKKKLIIIAFLSLSISLFGCTKIGSSQGNTKIDADVPNQTTGNIDKIDNTDILTDTKEATGDNEVNDKDTEVINETTKNITEAENGNETELDETDKIINKLNEYAQGGEFNEEGVDLLYEVIDTLSK